jgi:uncharacterized membrane protein
MPDPTSPLDHRTPPPGFLWRIWLSVRGRILAGLVVILPIVITCWVVYWVYTTLETHLIDPLARWMLWKFQVIRPEEPLPPWFERYAAPFLAVMLALALLYLLGFFARSRLRQAFDWVMFRVPIISIVYKGTQQILQTFNKQGNQPKVQRVVLIDFPHKGTKVPAFVTGSCRDVETQKNVLYVYVPTTPVPTSGYMLLVLEEDVVELNWTTEEALQAIISGGLTAPVEVRFHKPGSSTASQARVGGMLPG